MTVADEAVVADLWGQGLPATEIARRIGRSDMGVLRAARRLGLPPRQVRGGMLWEQQEDAILARRWREGATVGDIAADLGCSRNAVIGRAHRLSLPPRPSPIVRRAAPSAQDPQGVAPYA